MAPELEEEEVPDALFAPAGDDTEEVAAPPGLLLLLPPPLLGNVVGAAVCVGVKEEASRLGHVADAPMLGLKLPLLGLPLLELPAEALPLPGLPVLLLALIPPLLGLPPPLLELEGAEDDPAPAEEEGNDEDD